MQTTEINRLCKSFESIFPKACIQIIDSDSRLIAGKGDPPPVPAPPVFRSVKEFRTVAAPGGENWYEMSFPIPPVNQLFLYIPSEEAEDILTAAKMADSVIQLFLSKPSPAVRNSRPSDTMLLLDHLFHPAGVEDDTYTALLAAELGFDMSLPRAVCIFSIETNQKQAASKARISYSILQTIRNFASSFGNQDILGSFSGGELLLCHVMEQDDRRDLTLLENLYTYIHKNYPVSCSIGVGLTVRDMGRYEASFASAQAAFRYAQNRSCKDEVMRIYCVTDFLAEHLVYEIPDSFFEHFYRQELSYLQATPLAAATLKALVDSNMDIVTASEALFIHRNTMVFRLNQLKKQLRLNPLHKDNDRFKLILLHHYYTKKTNMTHLSGEAL
ncbi:MAG: helix-turn-helix domain-containing protein [Clostridium sp.]|nr:helix-turn-helix domain-containing protein [Clostridium sp.]